MRKPLAIIGMSPGNSYFKDFEVRFLLQESIERFGRCAVMVADVPAIATYMALGYERGRARNKAIPKGNNLKNRTRRLAESLGYTEEQVRIIDWAEEVESNPGYRRPYEKVREKYASIPAFADSVRKTTHEVLGNSGRSLSDAEAATDNATHYLLSELAFMEFAPEFFASRRVCYLYHRNWQVYEDYISGRYDSVPKPHLDFLLLEAPYETYEKRHSPEIDAGGILHDTYSRVMQSGILRAAYAEYPPVIQREGDHFSGIFYEIFTGFAKKHDLKIEWAEETGYGVVIEGLAEGRFDIFGSVVWPTTKRHTKAGLSRPLYFSDVGVWVRADSPLACADWIDLNDPQYRIAVTDGDITHDICLTDFTFAKWIRVPQLGRVKALLDFVADGRADATIAERMTYEAYAAGLSHRLVNIAHDKPIRRYPNCFLVVKHQNDFLDVLNLYIVDILASGRCEEIVRRYTDVEHRGIHFRFPTKAPS
jgi:polar amino acid transport system substrate-binding protein